MKLFKQKQRGQGMTEYIIIVALIAIGAIGVYKAFGNIVRGQTSIAASSLAGQGSSGAKSTVNEAGQKSNDEGQKKKGLKDFGDGAAE